MAPAKRKVSKVSSGGSVGGSDDEDYRKKRDRNNQVILCKFYFFHLDWFAYWLTFKITWWVYNPVDYQLENMITVYFYYVLFLVQTELVSELVVNSVRILLGGKKEPSQIKAKSIRIERSRQ